MRRRSSRRHKTRTNRRAEWREAVALSPECLPHVRKHRLHKTRCSPREDFSRRPPFCSAMSLSSFLLGNHSPHHNARLADKKQEAWAGVASGPSRHRFFRYRRPKTVARWSMACPDKIKLRATSAFDTVPMAAPLVGARISIHRKQRGEVRQRSSDTGARTLILHAMTGPCALRTSKHVRSPMSDVVKGFG